MNRRAKVRFKRPNVSALAGAVTAYIGLCIVFGIAIQFTGASAPGRWLESVMIGIGLGLVGAVVALVTLIGFVGLAIAFFAGLTLLDVLQRIDRSGLGDFLAGGAALGLLLAAVVGVLFGPREIGFVGGVAVGGALVGALSACLIRATVGIERRASAAEIAQAF